MRCARNNPRISAGLLHELYSEDSACSCLVTGHESSIELRPSVHEHTVATPTIGGRRGDFTKIGGPPSVTPRKVRPVLQTYARSQFSESSRV
jgi:hypothetical protein